MSNHPDFLNLTPHEIVLVTEDGDRLAIPPSGTVARVEAEEESLGTFPVNGDGDIPVVSRSFGKVKGLPKFQDVPVLVSSMVLAAVPNRAWTFAPDTGPTAIRENGQVVAVTRLVAA